MAKTSNTTTVGDPVVFISSTSEDLRPFRAAAEHAAKLAGFRPEMMEYFGASGRPSVEECLERVSDLTSGGTRVVRGGAFFNLAKGVRAALRRGVVPDDRSDDVGFRVVVSRF